MTQFRLGNFQVLPPVIKNLLIINVLFFLAQKTIGESTYFNMEDIFGLHDVASQLFKPWQIITHLFLHGGFTHILFNMFSLWMFGSVLENLWGPKKFITFYFVCGIGAALLQLTFLHFQNSDMLHQATIIRQTPTPVNIANFFNQFHLQQFQKASDILDTYISNPDNSIALDNARGFIDQFIFLKLSVVTIGASGAIAGVLAAFLYLFPNTELLVYFMFPVKAKWLGIIYFGSELYFAISNQQGDNVAHWAHLGGALVGFLLVLTWNKNNRSTFY